MILVVTVNVLKQLNELGVGFFIDSTMLR